MEFFGRYVFLLFVVRRRIMYRGCEVERKIGKVEGKMGIVY